MLPSGDMRDMKCGTISTLGRNMLLGQSGW